MLTNQYRIPLPVVIVGGGGHARVLIDALMRQETDIIGYTDIQDRELIVGGKTLKYLGTDERILQFGRQDILLVNGLGSVNLPLKRKTIFCWFADRGYHFATVVHPATVLGADVVLGEGAQVMAGAILQTAVKIGENAIVNTRAAIDHDCVIGAHVHVAPGATMSGNIEVGANSHIGAGSVIVQGVTVGDNALIAAGAVVIRDVANESTVMGVPARPVMKQDMGEMLR